MCLKSLDFYYPPMPFERLLTGILSGIRKGAVFFEDEPRFEELPVSRKTRILMMKEMNR